MRGRWIEVKSKMASDFCHCGNNYDKFTKIFTRGNTSVLVEIYLCDKCFFVDIYCGITD